MNKIEILSILAAIIGVAIHTSMAYESNRKTAKAANMVFTWADFWENDKINIILAFLSVVGWYLIFGEISKRFTLLSEYVVTSYLIFGAFGSYAIQYGWGRSKSLIRKTIDAKTNQLDEILNNKKEDVEYIWETTYWNDDDLFDYESSRLAPSVFAQVTFGTVDALAKTITYESEPAYSQVTVWLNGNSATTQIAAPIRKPK